MGHIIYILLLSMFIGGGNDPQIHNKVLSSHWSLNKCQDALQIEAQKIGTKRPKGVKLECIEIGGKISW